MKTLTLIVVSALLFASCSTEKTLLRGNEVYSYSLGSDPNGPKPAYTKYKVNKKKKVKVTDNGTYLIIKDDPSKDKKTYTEIPPTVDLRKPPVWKDENMPNAYFSEAEDEKAKSALWYYDKKFVLQTGSVPFKIRSAVRAEAYKDSFPSQTETGFNVSFLTGYKFCWNRFRGSNNIFGQTTDKFSVTPGVIIATGAADLSATSTRPKIVFPRKAPMISVGGAVVFGFNSINLGYAFGWDHAVGPSASTWLYKGKFWNGIIISLDLIK